MSYLIDRVQNELVNLIFDNRNNIKLLNKFKKREQVNEYVDRLSFTQIIQLEKEIKQKLQQKSH
jgi:hypothetical protein